MTTASYAHCHIRVHIQGLDVTVQPQTWAKNLLEAALTKLWMSGNWKWTLVYSLWTNLVHLSKDDCIATMLQSLNEVTSWEFFQCSQDVWLSHPKFTHQLWDCSCHQWVLDSGRHHYGNCSQWYHMMDQSRKDKEYLEFFEKNVRFDKITGTPLACL